MSFFYTIFGDEMKIYIDFVMILNFIIDFILLLSVKIILKRNTSINRILLGSFFGGLSILFLFFNINSFILFLFKLFISIVMVIISFKFINIKYTLINILYLYNSWRILIFIKYRIFI